MLQLEAIAHLANTSLRRGFKLHKKHAPPLKNRLEYSRFFLFQKNTPQMERAWYVNTSYLFHESDSLSINRSIAQILLKSKKFSTQFLNFLFYESPL